MDALRPLTLAAVDAARAGLALAREGTGEVHAKPGRRRDVVTDADLAVEDLVRGALARFELPVVGEERGGDAPPDAAYWMVDPICGTRNFASGIPLFAVNLALVESGELTAAVVGDGSTGAVHVAEKGAGAWTLLEAGPERLSAAPDSQVVAIGVWPGPGSRRSAAARFAAALVEEDRFDLRSFATTLTLAYLAAGRLAADVFFAGSALHFGAGALLAAEAGATVTDLEGAPWGVHSRSLLASAVPELHDDLLAMVEAARGASSPVRRGTRT